MQQMELTKLIRARAHRILGYLDRYQSLRLDALMIVLQVDEKAIGEYKNQQADFDETIVITTHGLHVFNNGWSFVEYSDIANVTIPLNPANDKQSADRVVVYLKSGKEIEIPITGGDERTRDAWSFFHFLMRVIKNIQKRSD